MNDTRPRRRPSQSPTPVRRSSPQRRRRRRRQNRQFQLFLLFHQIILVLIALGIGYFLGLSAGKAAAPDPLPDPTTGAVVQEPEPSQFLEPELSPGPADTVAPVLRGVNKLSLFTGSSISYTDGILVTDDTDPAPRLTVDSSQVDLTTPGTYPVFYTAADAAGNTATAETTVTVAAAPDTWVEESVILETADKLLGKILTDGMTKTEQVNAIYDWIESHCYYIANFDKTDYKQAAYLMMTQNRGDCYGFYAVSRLLFERLELPTLTVTRLPNEVRTTNHWWNMVTLDDGETWYHFDATPHLTYPTRTCLITDADLEAFNELMPNYYYFDHDNFPKTPEA